MASTNFTVRAGVPFARTIRVTLVEPYLTYWPDDEDFEVLSQVRASRSQTAELKVDLAQFLEYAKDGDDIVIVWSMTGADTRALEGKAGYMDMLITDVGTTDTHGLDPIVEGKLIVTPIVTAAAEDGEESP